MSADLHAAIERLASTELRSVNAQIEVLLREALRARGVGVVPDESIVAGDAGPDAF